MAHTQAQRDGRPLCGARKKNGEKCRAFAGQKTDHPGVGQCAFHGGATPNGRKHALKLEAQQRMVAESVRVEDAQPHLVLVQELAMSAGHVGFLREEIAGLEPSEIGGERSKVLLARFDHERDRLTRIARECSRAGVDEARIRIEEVKAAQIVQTITAAAKDAGIPQRYVRALGPALRRQFALVAGDEEAAEQAERRVAEIREQIATEEENRVAKRAAKRPPPDLVYPPQEWVAEDPSTA